MYAHSPGRIFGQQQDDLGQYLGSTSQLARIESSTLSNGPAAGTRMIRVVNGGGLDFSLLPDRALDIGHASFWGIPLTWVSSVETVSPHSYETEGTEWLRGFGGGLLATCGLDSFGPPSEDEGRWYPMHGRVGAIPATVTETSLDGGFVNIRGIVRQTKVFAENLVLRRLYRTAIGDSTLEIHDTVTNEGTVTEGHMMLYHFNFGWPLLGPRAHLHISSDSVIARDDRAQEGLTTWSVIGPPQLHFREQVYIHHVTIPQAIASIDNPDVGVKLELGFSTENLPGLFQWKMADHGHYVMGLEPANTAHVFGRDSARREGQLPFLEPGESVSYRLNLTAGPAQNHEGVSIA